MENASLVIRRLILVVISIVLGFIITYFVVTLPRPIGLDTTLDDYTYIYVFFTVGSLACGIGIWLDKFLKTNILPS